MSFMPQQNRMQIPLGTTVFNPNSSGIGGGLSNYALLMQLLSQRQQPGGFGGLAQVMQQQGGMPGVSPLLESIVGMMRR